MPGVGLPDACLLKEQGLNTQFPIIVRRPQGGQGETMVRENADIIMRCGRCSQQVPMSQMKYGKDGKMLLCPACRGESPQQQARQQPKPAVSPTVSRELHEATGPVTRYKCTSCGYNFTRRNIKPEKCPYCGKASVTELSKISSGKLLDDDVD